MAKPDLREAQRRMFAQVAYEYQAGGRITTLLIPDAEYEGQTSKDPIPYELPKSDRFQQDLRIVKHHNTGSFGSTAIVQILNASSEGVTGRWYSPVTKGQKIIAKRISASNSALARSWETESSMLKALGNIQPNILRIFGRLAPTNSDPYGHIFTEYCSLGDVDQLLFKYIGHKTFIPEAFVWQLVIDMGKALLFLNRGTDKRKEAGQKGWTPLVHNDIKLNNIFMKSRQWGANNIHPRFVLGDFGLCSREGEPAQPSCPPFMSPQRYDSFFKPTPASHKDDIFSLGVALFVLANGFFPFESKNDPIQPLDHTKRRNHKNPFRKGFCIAINACTSRHPDKRPSARELIGIMIGLIKEKGWSKEGSRDRLWPVDWMDKNKARHWDNNKQKVEI